MADKWWTSCAGAASSSRARRCEASPKRRPVPTRTARPSSRRRISRASRAKSPHSTPISASRVKTDHGKMIPFTDRIAIDADEIEEVFVRASGPGGQNVNKVATAIQLRFDALHSPSLDAATRARLRLFAGRRMTADGVLVIMARRFRTQERNRQDAFERLIDLIGRAAQPGKRRVPTRPTAASRNRRREAKLARGRTKRLRQPVEQQVE